MLTFSNYTAFDKLRLTLFLVFERLKIIGRCHAELVEALS
jgi:hypothetical protein